METRLPCKAFETQFMWLRVYFFPGIFGSVPGELYRFGPVPGARNCWNLHLITDIIHDCCNPMTLLVHLKQVKKEIIILI